MHYYKLYVKRNTIKTVEFNESYEIKVDVNSPSNADKSHLIISSFFSFDSILLYFLMVFPTSWPNLSNSYTLFLKIDNINSVQAGDSLFVATVATLP